MKRPLNQTKETLKDRAAHLFQTFLSLPLSRGSRILTVLVVYSAGLVMGLWLAYQLRFDFNLPASEARQMSYGMCWIVPMKLMLLLLIGQFAGLLSYFGIPDLRRLVLSLATGSLLLALLWLGSNGLYAPPRSVILADFLFSFLFLAALRLVFRLARENYFTPNSAWDGRVTRVAIVGAGYAGAALAKELFVKRNLGLKPVFVMDDNPQKWGTRLHDIPVIGAPETLLDATRNLNVDQVVIAMPSASGKRLRDVVHILQQAGLKFYTVPTLDQMATGKVQVTQLRPVDIEDLLGREPVQTQEGDIRGILENQVIMVTGAGGSIGSELCRQIARYRPRRLLLVERCEAHMFEIEQELHNLGFDGLMEPCMADILDYQRMKQLFEEHRPQVVFHAAAHKHVPMMEHQPGEAFKNNTLGTARVAQLALDYGVGRFVLISTDKAINPTNVMGATKRLAEMFLQSFAASEPGKTKFMAVRFGNVLGSSGSVIPTFNKQIAAGGPVKVTHPDVVRYFMTIPEAVGLVLQSGAQGKGGEIFVLDMGQPVKILDLARQLIELSGLKPDEDIEIKFTGLRPGEKLFEELCHQSENCETTNHAKIMRFLSCPVALKEVQDRFQEITQVLEAGDTGTIKGLLKKAVPEYQPYVQPAAPRPVNGAAVKRPAEALEV